MAKPKAKPKAAAAKAKTAVLAAQMKAKAKKPNPFELKGSKGHFDTIGRRLSGKKHNVITARQEAVNRRKKTLLVEYRQLRKANSFVDRRFGETDPELTEGDKGLARLQAQRMNQERTKKRRGSKFTLSEGGEGGGGEGEGLTHLGRSLADDLKNMMDRPEFDDLDEEMVEDLVAQYHFGGGGGEGGEAGEGEEGAAARGPDGKPKTRKQVMEEIIAKSRMYRALKAKQREEDDAALDAINAEYKQLVASAALSRLVKAPGENKWGAKVKTDNPEDAAYDVAARELAFESKGAAGDRTLSPEELLERERQRLERLEKERLKRMRGGGDEDEEREGEGDDDEEGEGRRKRRREQPSGDALGDDYDDDSEGEEDEDEEEEDGDEEDDDEGDGKAAGRASELDKRRMKAAAGNHPLQENFRAAAAALAKKYGMEAPKNPYLEEDEGEEEEDEEGEEEEDEEGDEESASGSGEGEDDDGDEEAEEQEQLEQRRHPAHPPSTSRPGGDRAAAGGASDATAPGKKKKDSGSAAAAKPLEGPLDLPYTIPLPSSYNQFAALVNGRPADELATAITRIRAFNAVALATDNKRKLQELYGILVQHFVMEAGKSPLPVPSLDVLTRVLLELTPEVPYYAATVARARLGRMSDQLTAALSGGAAAATSPWPAARVVLQLKLFTLLFPTSDRRHPVLTPAALLVGKVLNQCVVSNPQEAALGLCLCGLMTHIAAPAHRTTPEVLMFLRDCLAAFLPGGPRGSTGTGTLNAADAAGGAEAHKASSGVKRKGDSGAAAAVANGGCTEAAAPQQPQHDSDTLVMFPPGLLMLSAKSSTAPPPLDVYSVLATSGSDPRVVSDAFKLGLLRVALCGVRRSAALASEAGLVCLEQLFAPLRAVVSELKRIERHLPEELRSLRTSVLQQLSEASATCVAARRPLAHAGRAPRVFGATAGIIPAAAVREFNPRFEDGFVSGRDYDPDRQRAEQRRLKRAVVKERRGAVRELRRDAVFMADERDRETSRVDTERMDSERRFYSELQRQEADLRSGGQGGMNPHLKKKKGGGGKR